MSLIERRRFLGAAAVVLAMVAAGHPHAVFGQQPPRGLHRIGFLSGGGDFAKREYPSPYHQAFLRGLAEQGFVVGENLTIEYRFADRDFERLPGLARELVAQKPEVIFGCCHAGGAAAKATKSLPVVFAGITDPVASGMVQSLARPGGNVTGVSNQGLEINTKRLELLKAAVPTVRRVAVLMYGSHGLVEQMQHDLQAAAQSLGIRVDFFEVEAPNQIEGAFAAMKAADADSLLVQEARVFNFHAKQIARLALDGRLPSMCFLALSVQEGCLMSYEQDFVDMSRRAGGYVAKILKGASPADLPVEQPTKFTLFVNLKTAKALGLTMPPSILLRADRVIE